MFFDSLTEFDKEALDEIAVGFGTDLDHDRVAAHAKELAATNDHIEITDYLDSPPNKRAAAQLLVVRTGTYSPTSGYDADKLVQQKAVFESKIISTGKDLLERDSQYWRFEPTIERIFELNVAQAKKALEFLDEFQTSDYGRTFYRQREKFQQDAKYWHPGKETAENIETGIDCYRNAIDVFERSFPLLLGLKRILDEETPSVQEVQAMRASKIRRELTDTDTHEQSVYFDMIVNTFDSTIRNALSHGDIVHDPAESVIKIPNKNTEYTYDEFNQVATGNIATGVFLTGMFQALLYWSYLIQSEEEVTREMIPV